MPELDLKIIHSLLREIEAVARNASVMELTASPVLADTYNRCLTLLIDQGDHHVGLLFQPLPRDSASADDIGAASALLASYVQTKGNFARIKRVIHRGPARHPGHAGHPGHADHMPHPCRPDLFDLDEVEPEPAGDEKDRG